MERNQAQQKPALIPSSSLAVLDDEGPPLSEEAERLLVEEAEQEGCSLERAVLRLLLPP